MPGDRTQSQGQARSAASPPDRPADSAAFQEWYVVTGSGASALRISPGLTVGETDAGALALNDPETRHQWIEFVLSENGDPWVAIITRDKSLRVDGVTHMRHQLTVGAAVELPGNSLHISHDIRMPRPAGVVIEVVPRDVPTGPRDLVGPGWEAALAAVQEPAAAESAETVAEALEPRAPAAGGPAEAATAPPPDEDPDRTRVLEPRARSRVGPRPAERPAEPPADEPTEFADPLDDIGVTVAEPRPGRRYRRRPPRRRRASVVVASVAIVAAALGGAAAVLYSLNPPGLAGVAGFDLPLGDAPDGEQTPGAVPDQTAPPTGDVAPTAAGPGQDGSADVAGTSTAPTPQPPAAAPQDGSIAAAPGAGTPAGAAVDGSGAATGEDQVALLPTAEPDVDADRATGSGPAEPAPGSAPVEVPAAATGDPAPQPPGGGASASTGEPTSEPTAAPAGPPDWRLVRARELLEAGYVTYPPQDNAVAYLERLLAVDPGNPQALAMLDQCTVRLLEAAERAHDQGMEYEARNTLEEVLGFNPENARANALWREWVGARR